MSGPTADTGVARSVVVIGGGHNGLVAGLRLARAGCRVTVLEQGNEPGGCVWTERRETGMIVERGAFEHGGIRSTAAELGLDDPTLGDAALRYVEHPVSTGFLFGNGERRIFYTDLERTVAALGADGAAYRRLVETADVLFGMLDAFDEPPTLTQVAAALAPVEGGDRLFRTLLLPAETLLESALTDPYVRAALALQASHAQVPAWAPGSGLFAFLLPASHGGPAVRPVGGSRALVDALRAALERAGGTVRTSAPVVGLASRSRSTGRGGGFGGGVIGNGSTATAPGARVKLADGTVLEADAVISSIDLPRTVDLLADEAPTMREAARGLHSGHFNVSELTVSLVASRPFELPVEDRLAIWYAMDRPEDLRTGFAEVLAGQLPSAPWAMVAEVAQPDGVGAGALWLSSIVPLRRADGPWTLELERAAAERLIDHVSRVLGRDLRADLVDVVVSGPATWAARTGGDGNPNHLDNTVDQLLGWRPPGHAGGCTELPWLFLSGAGQHPGGGLSGASGSAAAAALLRGGRPAGWQERVRSEINGLRKGLAAYRMMRKGAL